MSGAVRRRLSDGRWHFQHGPIDCIVGADGDAAAVEAAFERAWHRFGGILAELVGELPLLRTDLASAEGRSLMPRGPIARRMVEACRPHAAGGRFITAMAAVAGSVAEELIGCFDDARIARAYVNNGGDIALRLEGDAAFTIGWVADPAAAALESRHRGHDLSLDAPSLDGTFRVDAAAGIRGIATSGWRGRSFSLGIADSATVLARSASMADAAATVVANAVDLDDLRIRRAPANRLRDDSDLGDRLVTCGVGVLPPEAVAVALERGVAAARAEVDAGRIVAAALCLQGQVRTVDARAHDATRSTILSTLAHAPAGREPLDRPETFVHGARPLDTGLDPARARAFARSSPGVPFDTLPPHRAPVVSPLGDGVRASPVTLSGSSSLRM